MTTPWQCLSSEVVLETDWLRIRRDQVRTHTGEDIEYTYVDHPGAVFIVPVTSAGEILMLRHWRYPVGEWCWEIPAGGMHEDPDPVATAERELAEEAGATFASIELVGEFFMSNGISNEMAHVFLATGVEVDRERDLEGTELSEVHRVPADEAMRMARSGEVSDGPSALALLLCEARLFESSEEAPSPSSRARQAGGEG